MTVDLDRLKKRIERHYFTPWRAEDGHTGPVVKDYYNNEILAIDVGYAVWACHDEQDGCPEVARDARAFAQLLVDLPGYTLELIEAVKRLQNEVQELERDLVEAERGF